MAYHKPTDIDGFVNQMSKADMRVKAQLAEDLVAYLGDYENSIVSDDLGLLVDGLLPWLTGSHYKVKLYCSSFLFGAVVLGFTVDSVMKTVNKKLLEAECTGEHPLKHNVYICESNITESKMLECFKKNHTCWLEM